jgi:hypothetical protein
MEGVALSLESQKKLDEAIQVYKDLEATEATGFVQLARYGRARLLHAKGDDAFLVGYEIDLPDEPGMDSGKLEWLGSEMLSAGEWDALVAARAAGKDVK